MQRYEITITAEHDMSEAEQLTVMDFFGDSYDSATMTARRIEVSGEAASFNDVAAIMSSVRVVGYTVSGAKLD